MPADPLNLALWLEPSQVPLARRVVGSLSATVVAAGSPMRGQSSVVAQELGVPAEDDLRVMLTQPGTHAVILWSTLGIGADAADARAVAAAGARSATVITLGPAPADVLSLRAGGWLDRINGICPAEVLRPAPLLRRSEPFVRSREVLEAFGRPSSVWVRMTSSRHEQTSGANLLSALDLLRDMLGEPAWVSAAVSATLRPAGREPESIGGVMGDVHALLRYADGRCASLCVGDAGGEWGWDVGLSSPQGRLNLRNDGVVWHAPNGSERDRVTLPPGASSASVGALSWALARQLDPAIPDDGPILLAEIMTVAQTLLLSASTGQPESPATIRAMTGGVA
jgi:hypothetical protein